MISSPVKADIVDISNVTTFSRNTTSAVIRWESNQVAGTSIIEYGATTSYGTNASDEQISYYHETTISSLIPGTLYHFKIRSTDYDNNETESADYNFTTPTQMEFDAAFASDLAQRRARGNVYFVRTDGNDTCNGNYNMSYEENQTDCAFQTIPNAISASASGDSIFIMPGNYTEDSTISITKSNLSIIGIGLPCIIQNNNNNNGIFLYNIYNITIDGLCIRNVTRGIYGQYTNYLTIRNNDIESINTTCGPNRLAIYGLHSPNTIVSGNKILTSGGGITTFSINATITHNTIDIYYKEDGSYCEDGGLSLSLNTEFSAQCGAAYNEWNADQICTASNISNAEISYNNIRGSNRNCLGPGDTNTVDVHHNIINNCDHNGIDLHGTINAKVHSNAILNMTQDDSSSILTSNSYLDAGNLTWANGGRILLTRNLNIYNNYIYNNAGGGVLHLSNPVDITLYNNIIIDKAWGGSGYQGDNYNDYPQFCYGVRFIKNRIYSDNNDTVSSLAINCLSKFTAEPYVAGLMDRSHDSSIFMDNEFNVPDSFCFNLGVMQTTVYSINNNFTCQKGLYTWQTASEPISGNIQRGYYLNIRALDENSNPVSDALITIESTRTGYSSYSISEIYGNDGLPVTNNSHLLENKTTTYTLSDGYSPSGADSNGTIFLPGTIMGHATRITNPIIWKITISKEGYYPRTFFYSVGTDDYKINLADRTNAKTIILKSTADNKKIFGTGGLAWQTSTTNANISEDNVTQSLEISQLVGNITGWWKLDQNESLGAFDSVGSNHGIFEDLGTNTSWVTGNYRNGLKLTGLEYIRMHNDNVFNAENNSTVCMTTWIKPQTDWNDDTFRSIISETEGNNIAATKHGWYFSKKVVSDGLYLFVTKNTSYNEIPFNTLAWTADTWHFVALCFDQYKAKIWKDDTNRTIMTTSSQNAVTGPYSIWIGNSGTNITFDDIRLYNHWLSNEEMTNIKNNAHKTRGTITSVPQLSGTGRKWTSVSIKGTIPDNTSVILDIYTSSDNINYTRTSLSNSTEINHIYEIPSALQKRYAYFEITLETNDSSSTPTISNIIMFSSEISPVVTLTSPQEQYNTSQTSLNFTFRFIDDTNTTMSCSLHINNTLIATNSSTINATTTTFSNIPVSPGLAQNWTVNCTDWTNTNHATIRTFNIDTIPPAYSENSTNSTTAGTSVLHSLHLEDNLALAGYIFSFDNGIGSYTNDTYTTLTGTDSWSNVTKTINSTIGQTIRWKVYTNDSVGNWNVSDEYSYNSTDAIPIISVSSPANTTYNTSTTTFRIVVSEPAPWCGYSLDNTPNITMSNYSLTSYNHTNTSMANGLHSVIFSCNDTTGNMNSTQAIYFTIDVDYTPPLIQFTSPTNNTGETITTRNYLINWTLTETHPYITIFSWNGTNTTLSSITTSVIKSSLPNGIYTYYVWANDTFGNSNMSDIRTITINYTDTTAPNITIINPSNHTTLTYTTTSVTLNITTDENATCRYNTTTSNFNYTYSANMTITGSNNHLMNISVSSGNTYTYYYKCNDTEGNINENATTHRFSIASAPTTPSSGGSSSSSSSSGGGTALPTTPTQNETNETEQDNNNIITGHTIDTNTTEEDNTPGTDQTENQDKTDNKPDTYQPEEKQDSIIKYIIPILIIMSSIALIIAKVRKDKTKNPPTTPTQKETPEQPEIQKQKLEEIEQYVTQIRPIIIAMKSENSLDPKIEEKLKNLEEKIEYIGTKINENKDTENDISEVIEMLTSLKQEIEDNH